MTIREKIWYEIWDSKKYEFYTTYYISLQKRIRKWVKIIIIVFSINGVLSWKVFQNPLLAQISSYIVAGVALLQLVENFLYHNDDEIDCLSQMNRAYKAYNSKVEKLWLNIYSSLVSVDDATNQFYEIKDAHDKEMADFDKKVRIKPFSYYQNKAELATKNYLQRYNNQN